MAVADDDPHLRAAVTEVLGADDRFEVVGAVESGDALLALLRGLADDGAGVDVVLVDVRMPGGGVAALRSLRETFGDDAPPVVVISAHTSARLVLDMLAEGAAGYLGKGRIGANLADLVAGAVDGELVLAVPGAQEILRRHAETAR